MKEIYIISERNWLGTEMLRPDQNHTDFGNVSEHKKNWKTFIFLLSFYIYKLR